MSQDSREALKRKKLDFTEEDPHSTDAYKTEALLPHKRPYEPLPAGRPVDSPLDRALTEVLLEEEAGSSSSSRSSSSSSLSSSSSSY